MPRAAEQILALRRARQSTAWQLLAADNAPVVLGMLQAHLLEKERRLPSTVLRERIAGDLEELRARGFDLPQPAEAYMSQWLRSGYLERSYQPEAAEEEYELSAAAVRAIQFVQSLGEQRAVATESRLSLVFGQLRQLAEQTEADPERRLEALQRERARLDAEIAAVARGEFEPLPADRALERAREILALADELANDFRRVREDFQQLNRELREQILDADSSRGEVLEKLFAGVDVIAEADAGRTFKAFWRLLTDPEQSVALENALEDVLSRDFSRELSRRERRFLLQLTRLLLERGGEVHEVFQHFARSLKHFVQSQEFREQRRLNRLLALAQRRAAQAKEHVRPTADVGHVLYLSSAGLRSVAQWQLHDPIQDRVNGGIARAEPADITLETVGELVAGSEIDFRRLREQLRELLSRREPVTVADVLAAYPAEQGLGSVVGLVALGVRHGTVSEQTEQVAWEGADGAARRARIPRIFFTRAEFDDDIGTRARARGDRALAGA